MCSLSTSHLYGLPNQWRGVFHTHRQGLGLCSKIGHIYVLICDASLGWKRKKVSGHFVGGSIVHQNITELPLYNNDEPSKTSIQDKITTTACAPWFLTDDFNWKPLKNCRSIMKWNTVRYCMLYHGDSFLLLVWTNKKGNFLIEKEGLLYYNMNSLSFCHLLCKH